MKTKSIQRYIICADLFDVTLKLFHSSQIQTAINTKAIQRYILCAYLVEVTLKLCVHHLSLPLMSQLDISLRKGQLNFFPQTTKRKLMPCYKLFCLYLGSNQNMSNIIWVEGSTNIEICSSIFIQFRLITKTNKFFK